MKNIILFLILIGFLQAENIKLDKLVIGNETYTKVVLKKNADGVTIYHTDGVKRIDYKLLPENVKSLVGEFNEKEAAKAKQEQKKNEAASEKLVVLQKPTVNVDKKPIIPKQEVKQGPFKKVDLEGSKLQPAKGL